MTSKERFLLTSPGMAVKSVGSSEWSLCMAEGYSMIFRALSRLHPSGGGLLALFSPDGPVDLLSNLCLLGSKGLAAGRCLDHGYC